MHTVTSIPALSDNYIHLIRRHQHHTALVIDPGEARPVLQTLQEEELTLEAILITHKHADHIGGVQEILHHHPQASIIAPSNCPLPNNKIQIVHENDSVTFFNGDLNFVIIHTPGHTLEHIAYFGDGLLFCGDTLFPCGCGRVFEGTFAQMLNGLDKLAKLPPTTLAYCGHEYTQKNIAFAFAADPNNPHLPAYEKNAAAKIAKGESTSPFILADEMQCNPFLRVREPALIAAAQQRGVTSESAEEVFATLRQWKDNF